MTPPDTVTTTDTEILEELDFPIVCIVRVAPYLAIAGVHLRAGNVSPQCQNPAIAQLRCRGCGSAGFICVEHRSQLLGLPSITCHQCNASGPALVVYEFTSLGRDS